MKIQNNKSYNVNFGCQRLFQATLKQPKLFGIEKNTDVFISELETSDLFRMDDLKHYWEKSHFGLNIIRNFVSMSKEYNSRVGKDLRYYIVENPKSKPKEQIKAMAIAQIFGNNVYLSMLQSESQFKKAKAIKGAGSCLAYAISRLAHSQNKELVSVIAAKNSGNFYKKLGYNSIFPDGAEFIMHKTNFDKFEKGLEQKYSIEPIINFPADDMSL